MRLAGVKDWLTGPSPDYAVPEAVIAAASALGATALGVTALGATAPIDAALPSAPLWTTERIAVTEGLWGEGFLAPGGESEVLRFVRPLGLSAAASLLLVGAGAGGPSCTIARQLGVLVSGFEQDPALAAIAAERAGKTGLGIRIQTGIWDPGQPVFPAGAYHHGLALEPLRGAHAEPVLAAIGEALRPGGQLVLLETTADPPPHAADADPAAIQLSDLPSEAAITRMLGRLGFDVRGVEDISERHAHLAVLGWRDAVRRMRGERPSPVQAALLVREAELWCRRLRLLRTGRLQLLRWHAVRKGGPAIAGHSATRGSA